MLSAKKNIIQQLILMSSFHQKDFTKPLVTSCLYLSPHQNTCTQSAYLVTLHKVKVRDTVLPDRYRDDLKLRVCLEMQGSLKTD